MTDIGDVIYAARRAKGLTETTLSSTLGISQAALSRYENGMRTPDSEMMEKLSEVLGLSGQFLSHSFRLQGAPGADAHMRRQKTTKVSD